ncbi:helix-turn-helix transcriptional regulator, partial [bacterium]|nr:helix-turn-helix transcriptional regulator [bacterium]
IAAAGELSCGQVGERFPLAQPTISHHMKILTDAGLIICRREAQHSFMSVNRALLDRVLGLLPERFEAGGSAPKPVRPAKKGRRA